MPAWNTNCRGRISVMSRKKPSGAQPAAPRARVVVLSRLPQGAILFERRRKTPPHRRADDVARMALFLPADDSRS
jgi:hypothetical protein